MAKGNLFRLVTAFRRKNPPKATRRAATWLLWADGRLDDVRGDIGPADVAAALRLCHESGIDARSRRIWADAPRLLEALRPGEARNWLAELVGAPVAPILLLSSSGRAATWS